MSEVTAVRGAYAQPQLVHLGSWKHLTQAPPSSPGRSPNGPPGPIGNPGQGRRP